MKLIKVLKKSDAATLKDLKPGWNGAEYLGSNAKPKHVEWVKQYLIKLGYGIGQPLNEIDDKDWNKALEFAIRKVGDAPSDPDVRWLLQNKFSVAGNGVFRKENGGIIVHVNREGAAWSSSVYYGSDGNALNILAKTGTLQSAEAAVRNAQAKAIGMLGTLKTNISSIC